MSFLDLAFLTDFSSREHVRITAVHQVSRHRFPLRGSACSRVKRRGDREGGRLEVFPAIQPPPDRGRVFLGVILIFRSTKNNSVTHGLQDSLAFQAEKTADRSTKPPASYISSPTAILYGEVESNKIIAPITSMRLFSHTNLCARKESQLRGETHQRNAVASITWCANLMLLLISTLATLS